MVLVGLSVHILYATIRHFYKTMRVGYGKVNFKLTPGPQCRFMARLSHLWFLSVIIPSTARVQVLTIAEFQAPKPKLSATEPTDHSSQLVTIASNMNSTKLPEPQKYVKSCLCLASFRCIVLLFYLLLGPR